ncbi:MAG: substrate-binding domain-containing protein [Kofleriaceae bacterium]|nr:substrate-binding domain-containing protein [Kofleriaceae bacterium]
MAVTRQTLVVLVALAGACKSDASSSAPAALPARPRQTLRVAVIGGMMETGFWPAIQERYERVSGDKIELVASGPKPKVIEAFRQGNIDVITVHASDAMVNLVADGLARDPQPWVRNDLIIVGPKADPAGVRGSHDAVAALGKIIAAKAPLLVHASNGADGVLHDLQHAAKLVLDPATTHMFLDENQHAVLERAAALGAYTMIGRIPFLTGKLRAEGIELMVTGDPRLQRPYLVEVSTRAQSGADDLVAFLRSPELQGWIATFGKGKYDDAPLFFPVTVPPKSGSPHPDPSDR